MSDLFQYRVFLLLSDGLHVEGLKVDVRLGVVLLDLTLDQVSHWSVGLECLRRVIHAEGKVNLQIGIR